MQTEASGYRRSYLDMTMERWDAPALYLSDGQFPPDLKIAPISWLEGESLIQRGGMTFATRHRISLLALELGAAVSNPTSCSAVGQPGESRGCCVLTWAVLLLASPSSDLGRNHVISVYCLIIHSCSRLYLCPFHK